jgi:prepilin-type N-terminal cleavage/methylation domain-containing protein
MRRRGFTLVEVLIVTAIIAILAGVAFVRFGNTPRNRARSGALRVELRNIMVEQDIFYTKNKRYARTLEELEFNPSSGTIIEFLGDATATGWRAKVSNPDATPVACSIFVGDAERIPPAETPGTINCQ